MSDWRKEVKKDSPFLYHFDIEGKSPVEVEIAGEAREEAYLPGQGEGSLWCLKLKGAKKIFGVGAINGWLIEHVTGTADKNKWIGKRILLRVAEWGKNNEKCIRVHVPPGTRIPKRYKRFKYIDADPDKPAKKSTPAPQQQAQSGDPAGPAGCPSVPEAGAPDVIAALDAILKKGDVDADDYGHAFHLADPDKQMSLDEDMEAFISRGDWYAAVRWIRRKVAGE